MSSVAAPPGQRALGTALRRAAFALLEARPGQSWSPYEAHGRLLRLGSLQAVGRVLRELANTGVIEVRRLRSALEKILNPGEELLGYSLPYLRAVARDALAGKG